MDLARQPLIGAPRKLCHPDLAGIRKWRVKDFDNSLIFYLPRQEGVAIVRVLHGAQDWWSLRGINDQNDPQAHDATRQICQPFRP